MRFILLTVLVMLCANSLAWAAEGVAEAFDAHEDAAFLGSESTPGPAHVSHADHCCHSAAHFLGFASDDALARANPAVRTAPLLASAYRSLRHAPPTQPPRL